MVRQSVEDTNVTAALADAMEKAGRREDVQLQSIFFLMQDSRGVNTTFTACFVFFRTSVLAPAESERICIVCQVKLRTVAFNPCGHFCICTDCAEHEFETCPVCREDVISTIKIFK